MAPRRQSGSSGSTPVPSKPRGVRGRSKNRDRHTEDAMHHEMSHPLPHPPRRTLKKPTGLPRHFPHTQPAGQEFNIDHGTHDDRPRPGKLAKKGGGTGKK